MNQPPAPLSHRVDRPVPPGKAAASDAPVRRLWQLRWNVAARAARMGYAVLSLEPDTFVTEDVYQAGGERRWGWLGGCMGGRGGGGRAGPGPPPPGAPGRPASPRLPRPPPPLAFFPLCCSTFTLMSWRGFSCSPSARLLGSATPTAVWCTMHGGAPPLAPLPGCWRTWR